MSFKGAFMDQRLITLQKKTEAFLTWNKRRRIRKKEKQKQKNPIIDWLEAFLWAACVVLLINQYFLQAYQIPSGSMTDTLLIKDRIFVNKFIYGPELIPGRIKLPGFTMPKRAQVIIFENPSYISKGPAFDIIQRILYMVTLSFVDIDRDEFGRPKAHFLIKRAIGMEYDRLRLNQGDIEILPRGEGQWLTEQDFQKISNTKYPVRRMLTPNDYKTIVQAGIATAYEDTGLSGADIDAINKIKQIGYADGFAYDKSRIETLYKINPQNSRYGSIWRIYNSGWYIPEGHFFPMGDNRDNSKDARFFGPVVQSKVLGQAMFKYWPIHRIGAIK
jgi:signal peptidase I